MSALNEEMLNSEVQEESTEIEAEADPLPMIDDSEPESQMDQMMEEADITVEHEAEVQTAEEMPLQEDDIEPQVDSPTQVTIPNEDESGDESSMNDGMIDAVQDSEGNSE